MDHPQLANTLFLIGLAMLVVVMLRQTNRYFKRKTAEISQQQPIGTRTDMIGDVARHEVHLHELARDLAGQLDTKIHLVEQLVRDAQAQAARLEAIIARAERTVVSSHAEDDLPGWDDMPADSHPDARCHLPVGQQADLTLNEIYRMADAGYTSHAIAERLDTPIGDVELAISLRARTA